MQRRNINREKAEAVIRQPEQVLTDSDTPEMKVYQSLIKKELFWTIPLMGG
ncbi:hypothetical protein [Limibacterium fermenti]|jgi:hypothetical protein|uniref:hypothetical protein n=1 Tax=Limibacterium fermenti TaxID=3229863 RepID=UPI003A6E7AA7